MSKAKSIVSWKLKMDIEWDDGEIEEIDFPEYLADYVDAYLTEIEEERAREQEEEED
jgi:hypothetical protein